MSKLFKNKSMVIVCLFSFFLLSYSDDYSYQQDDNYIMQVDPYQQQYSNEENQPDNLVDNYSPESNYIQEKIEIICNDSIDDDGDGWIDCFDQDCYLIEPCGSPEICDDNIDNDNDGLIDCVDPDCSLFEPCVEQSPGYNQNYYSY